ncbi:MAG: MarR family transcriptional regulator [Pseudomonadota bacterium]
MTNTATPARKKASAKAPASTIAMRSTRPPEQINWDARLGFLMHDVSRLRRIVFDEVMRPFGLTRSQWWILAHLSRHDGMIQSDLANVLDLGKAALGGLLDRLEASSFIERRPDDTDRRVKRIHLTSKGSRMIVEMRTHGHDMSERMLKGLSTEARHALVESLAVIKSNLLEIKNGFKSES